MGISTSSTKEGKQSGEKGGSDVPVTLSKSKSKSKLPEYDMDEKSSVPNNPAKVAKPPKGELTDFFNRLHQVKNKTYNYYQTVLFGNMFGGITDFTRLMEKVKSDWRNVVGTFDMVDRSFLA